MNVTALALVVASALLHAIWNLLLKKANDRVAFVWWYLLVPLVVFAPAAALTTGSYGTLALASVGIGIVSGIFQAANLLAMSWAYRDGDLSVVYPLSRGSAQVLIVLLGVGLLGEELSVWGKCGVALVLLGVYVVFLPSLSRRDLLRPVRALALRSSQAALFAGLAIALYHVLDKQGIEGANPFLYICLLYAADLATVSVYLAVRRQWPLVRAEWRANRLAVLIAGPLGLLSYLLVLFALGQERVAYVGPARNAGIVFSVVLGALFLKERHGRMRVVGSALIVAGLALAGAGG
ncbi:MAG: EamA family transporter [Candidatus Brocadiae bacterium]|nr:EamA family transporter [Candidatus Brocadiia bacterium]